MKQLNNNFVLIISVIFIGFALVTAHLSKQKPTTTTRKARQAVYTKQAKHKPARPQPQTQFSATPREQFNVATYPLASRPSRNFDIGEDSGFLADEDPLLIEEPNHHNLQHQSSILQSRNNDFPDLNFQAEDETVREEDPFESADDLFSDSDIPREDNQFTPLPSLNGQSANSYLDNLADEEDTPADKEFEDSDFKAPQSTDNDEPQIADFDRDADRSHLLLEQIRNDRLLNGQQIRWSLDDAILAALFHSKRVTGLQIQAVEELQNVGIQTGDFDARTFIEQSFRDSIEPVGNSIDVAAAQDIINERDLNYRSGIRRNLRSGGDFEISQSYQLRDNDSGILVPEDQVISRFTAQLNKELLRGAGRSIAMNQVLVAWQNASAQRAESTAEIANHLTEVMNAYWDIFEARGALIAARENHELAIGIFGELRARAEIDAEQNLLDQARATISQRQILINDAVNNLAQAQIQFVSLVNAPELLQNAQTIEILPQVNPDLTFRPIDAPSRVNTAIQRRPEIADAIAQIQSARALNHLALNQLLPQLTLSLETSLNGLDGGNDIGGAFSEQFNNGPTYGVGFNFELPIGNRAARFGRRRTELTVSRLQSEWELLIEQVKAEVLRSSQDYYASQQRVDAQRNVVNFSASELHFLDIRKRVAPRENANPSFALTQILAAQDRQGTAKAGLSQAIAQKQRAIFEMNRASGILINEDVIPADGCLPGANCFAIYHQLIEESPEFTAGADHANCYALDRAGPVITKPILK